MPFNSLEALQAFGMGAQAAAQRRALNRQERELDRREQVRTDVSQRIGAGDYQGATQAAIGGGEFDLAGTLQNLDEGQRKQALTEAQVLGNVAAELKAIPAEQRSAAFQRYALILRQVGFGESELTQAVTDLSDETLTSYVGMGQRIGEMLHPKAATAPYRFRNNSGDLIEIAADGKPRVAYDDPREKTDWVRYEDDNGLHFIPMGPDGPQTGGGAVSPSAPSPQGVQDEGSLRAQAQAAIAAGADPAAVNARLNQMLGHGGASQPGSRTFP